MKKPALKYESYPDKMPKEWWDIFYKSLKECLLQKKGELHAFFVNDSDRTAFYKGTLIPEIGIKMGALVCTVKEYHRVDAILKEKTKSENLKNKSLNFTGGYEVPIVYVESENSLKDLVNSGNGSEVYKLCHFQGPLKIIFTNAKQWGSAERRDFIEEDLQYVFDAFVNVHGCLNCYFVFIITVIENGRITFHFEVHDEMGVRINGVYNSFTI